MEIGSIDYLCFYFATYDMLFNSLFYGRNAPHKYLSYISNNNIEIEPFTTILD